MVTNKKSRGVKSRVNSFKYAFEGLSTLFKSEPNALIHLLAVLVVVFFGIFFEINKQEWIIVLLLFALVFISELFNSAIEYLSDIITTDHHPLIKKIKDMAAAAVLISALISLAIGLIIFIPKIGTFLDSF
ncbi:MAG: diacylglycerol kinase family protein [Bacteroidia bacterium]|nr:diacylglycerol kinase family protein [Bacteroidia bacterium]NNC85650.1 diacylglycerol kinase family protein [Bacteroidia bacterium]NNM16358.1 diacylglycerol kinase family protein [Bacteroidia bacterium]